MGRFAWLVGMLSVLGCAESPYVVVVDDGTFASFRYTETTGQAEEDALVAGLVRLYRGTGAPLPEIMSIWSTVDFDGSPFPTSFISVANDASGIGYATIVPDARATDGVFRRAEAPLRSILVHNNILVLKERSERYTWPLEGLPQYLFMLEVSHNWGAAIGLAGPDAQVLLGTPPHWSFWLDAESVSGGNAWRDNRDGTFTVAPRDRITLAYAPIDLYLMGLVPASEVPPFGVLEDVVVPQDAVDALHRRPVSRDTFPWTGPGALTVTARRRVVTIDDVVAFNGPRKPAYGATPSSWSVGFVLLVTPSDSEATVAHAEALMDSFIGTLPDTFRTATGGRGALRVVTAL